jgi:hypothetical protein
MITIQLIDFAALARVHPDLNVFIPSDRSGAYLQFKLALGMAVRDGADSYWCLRTGKTCGIFNCINGRVHNLTYGGADIIHFVPDLAAELIWGTR